MSRAVTLANFASGEALTVDETNDRVGIASTTPDATLDIKNTILIDGDAGIVTATSFVGAVTGNVTGNTSGTAGGLTGTPAITVGDVVATGATFTSAVTAGGVALKNGDIVATAATFSGVVTYEDVTQVDSVGIITARTGIKVLAGGADIVGVVTGTNFLKTDGSAVGGEFDITSCLFV
tara:strand:+ start:26 stop:562 length:537 start_codon:yes stop_codon:yes gene_type:complete